MTINERIALVRKESGLSMAKFGDKILISRNSVSLIENGTNNPSRQTVDLICREFNVNREWLETGAGEMYLAPIDEDARLFAELINLGGGSATVESVKAVLKMYLSLDDDGKKVLDRLITEAVERTKKDPAQETGSI